MDVLQTNEQQALRLIDLPPEVLASLSSDGDRLVLKSPEQDASGDTVLCNSTKTWAIRQVQSSNALLLLRRNPVSQACTAPALIVTASCNGTVEVLELKDASGKQKPVISWVAASLPAYGGGIADISNGGPSLQELLNQIPFSDGEILAAWTDLLAFEIGLRSFRPSPKCVLGLWQAMVKEAKDLSIDLAEPFLFEDLFAGSLRDRHPLCAYEAFIRKLTGQQSLDARRLMLDRAVVVEQIGEAIVATSDSTLTGDVLKKQLLPLLPWTWSDSLHQDRLSRMCLSKTALDQEQDQAAGVEADVKQDSKRKPNARNWHEKFKKTKR